MKILMISPHPPFPPNSGGRIRQWEQIRCIGRHHELSVVCFAYTEEEFEQRTMLDGLCSKFLMIMHPTEVKTSDIFLRQRLPWPFQWYGTAEMHRALAGLPSGEFDIVLVENIFMAHYQELFSVPSILQEYNIESQIYRQLAALRREHAQENDGQRERAFWNATWMLMATYENQTWPKFPLRTTVSLKDKQEIDCRCQTGRTIVIENGVNTERLKAIPEGNSHKVLFMGTLGYFPNADAAIYLAQRIMPEIWKYDPTITLCIAGRNPPESLRQLAADPRIEVIPDPEDMSVVAQQCALTVVPMRIGGGTRLKILDSMSLGLPVVSTSLGCEGLSVHDGAELLVRDEPEQFARAVLEILSDSGLKSRLRRNGRKLVEEHYDWRCIFERLENELLMLVDQSKSVQ